MIPSVLFVRHVSALAFTFSGQQQKFVRSGIGVELERRDLHEGIDIVKLEALVQDMLVS